MANRKNPMSSARSATHLTVEQWARREGWPSRRAQSSADEGRLAAHVVAADFTVRAKGIRKTLRAKDL